MGGRADLDRWDSAQGACSWAGAGAKPAVRRWVREQKMRLGWNRPATVVPLDPEQALDLTVYIYTYVSACARTLAHAVNREQYSQTNANANAHERK